MSDHSGGRRRKASGSRTSSFTPNQSDSRKRPKHRESATRDRPEPPPPPPASLVRLLKSDPSVLNYFTSLQENLEWDVQKWKIRARDYQSQLEALQQQDLTNSRNDNGSNGRVDNGQGKVAASSLFPSPDTEIRRFQEEELSSSQKKEVAKTILDPPEQGIPIDDSMLDEEFASTDDESKDATTSPSKNIDPDSVTIQDHMLRLSSDDSSSSDESDDPTDMQHTKDGSRKHTTSSAEEDVIDPTQYQWKQSIEQLIDAKHYLTRLGVSLIENCTAEADDPLAICTEVTTLNQDKNGLAEANSEGVEINDEAQAKNCEDGKQGMVQESKTTTRRSVEAIAADLCRAIKSLTRLNHSHGDQSYFPFMSADFLPCYKKINLETNAIPHPAIEGRQCALSALVLLDSNSRFLRDGIEKYSSMLDDDYKRSVANTLAGQHIIVDSFLQSLHGEMEQVWAIQDRSARRRMTMLHFQEESEELARKQREEEDLANDWNNSCADSFGPKSHGRLASLAERCLLAEVLVSIYLIRRDPQQAARLVWNYVVSTAPALDLSTEDYPCLPPVLSLCVLEAMLCPDDSAWLPEYCRRHWWPLVDGEHRTTERREKVSWFAAMFLGDTGSLACRTFAVTIRLSASIFEMRQNSSDDRISDIARVELAAYNRLIKSEGPWLQMFGLESSNLSDYRLCTCRVVDDFVLSVENGQELSPEERYGLVDSASLALILIGHAEKVDDVFANVFALLKSWSKGGSTSERREMICGILHACARAKRQLEIRKLDEYRQRVLSRIHPHTDNMDGYATRIVNSLIEGQFDDCCVFSCAVVALLCCHELSDGEGAARVIQWLLLEKVNLLDNEVKLAPDTHRSEVSNLIATVERVSCLPTIRVINLERRKDRLSAFMSQAHCERLMIVKGVTHIDGYPVDEKNEADSYLNCRKRGQWCGGYAFDGHGNENIAEARIVSEVCGGQNDRLERLVESTWRPNDLKPFDKAAPESEDLVRLTPSEKACALSHAATWMGVRRCLDGFEETINHPPRFCRGHENRDLLVRYPSYSLRQFQISGYARGHALVSRNEGFGATPVCVVLEDDAILNDRFVDRLNSILEELPRDFHYCALGYGRPKTAPMVPFSSQLGIPTCLWYMTGYILSLEGAKYLLGQLPIRGPVDSWIGLLMFGNWDNSFGHSLGIGKHSRIPAAGKTSNKYGSSHAASSSAFPSRRDLSSFLRFRAFAALTPLCSQKVGADVASSGIGNSDGHDKSSWRQRDSDITYSGKLS